MKPILPTTGAPTPHGRVRRLQGAACRAVERLASPLAHLVSRVKPLVWLLHFLSRVAPDRPRVQKALIAQFYQFVSAVDGRADIMIMNYGYEPLNPDERLDLSSSDERHRYGIQLYQRVAGAINLRDQDVLEVGCGRGGGAAFLARTLAPRSMTGVDFADRAIAFCNRHHHWDGLSFKTADAEHLPFLDGSFDAVVNVESSHCYPEPEQFLREVARVLRADGHFLFADFRPREELTSLREQLSKSELELVEEETITPNVVRAMEEDSGRRINIVARLVPRMLRPMFLPMFLEFAGIRGSSAYEGLRTGQLDYVRWVLRKRARSMASS